MATRVLPDTIPAGYRRLIIALRELRTSSGKSQRALAHQLGRPQSYVSKYETGRHRLDLVDLHHIADALEADLITLIEHFAGQERPITKTPPRPGPPAPAPPID